MKKVAFIFTFAVAIALAQAAWATSTISASPSTQNVAPNSTFQVTFSLAVTGDANDPSTVKGVDLFLQALNSQNGGQVSNLFSIASQTPATGWLAAGPGDYPDPFQTSMVHSAGNAENTEDQAVTRTNNSGALNPPFTATAFETLTFNIGAAPAGTYNFSTTAPTSTSDPRGTHITDASGAYFIPTNQASFSITVSAVPEPATCSLFGLGMLGAVGVNLLRARRKI
jgi:hypothetical protein